MLPMRSFERHVTINEQMAGSLPVIVIIVERAARFSSSYAFFPSRSPSMKENERGERRAMCRSGKVIVNNSQQKKKEKEEDRRNVPCTVPSLFSGIIEVRWRGIAV